MDKGLVWKQELAGRYVSDDGKEIEVIDDGSCIAVTDNQAKYECFTNMDALAEYLNIIGLPPLFIIPRSDPTEWKLYDKFKPFDLGDVIIRIWCRCTEEKNIEVLMLMEWSSGLHSLYIWDGGLQYPMRFEMLMLSYVEKKGKNPETDFDVAVSEAVTHGSSGMSKTWHGLTLAQAEEVLKTLGIINGLGRLN